MKQNIKIWALASLFSLLAVTACEEPAPAPDPDPVFPTTVLNETVAAGASVEVNFTPNLDWEVALSGDGSGNYFWIDDAGMKATKISGKAQDSNVTVTVVFSEDEEFDNNRVCDVTLKMGGESKKIATITRPSLGRTFDAYAGVAGEFEFTEDFTTEKITEVSLVTFEGSADYLMPVRVVTNFAWNVALPDWIKAVDAEGNTVSAGQIGTTEFFLNGILTKDVIEGAAGVVRFIDPANTEAAYEIKVTLPSCADRAEFQINSLTFNKEAQVLMPNGSYADQSAIGYLLAAEGAVVRALEWEGKWHATQYASWVDAKIGEYDASAGVLQNVPVTIDVTENAGPERYADIFVFPVSMANVKAEDICDMNSPTCAFKPEYEKYCIGRLTQGGIVPPYITPISTPEAMAEVGTYFADLEAESEDNILKWDFKAPVYHKITYTGELSPEEASFECNEAYSKVKVFADVNFPFGEFSKDVTEDKTFWLKFTSFAENKKGRFSYNSMPETQTHAAAVFYDADDSILAAVLIVFDPSSTGEEEEGVISLKSGEAELVKLTSGDVYEVLASNYTITDVFQVTAISSPVSLNSATASWNHFFVDPATFQEVETGSISMENNSTYFNFYPNGEERKEMIIVFQTVGVDGESFVNYAAVHFIYDPTAEINVTPAFSFTYPDMVSGATLARYEGPMLDVILADFGGMNGLKASKVWELKYTVAEPSMAMITVPSMPFDGAAWNNYPFKSDYWLTYEPMTSDSILVVMDPDNAKNNDYFVFKTADGLFDAVLVCTYEPAANE